MESVGREYNERMISKVFRCLQSYGEYRRQKRVNDYVMGKAVEGLEKKRVVQVWRKKLKKHIAVKMLGYSF